MRCCAPAGATRRLLPPGAEAVLAALRSAWVVLDNTRQGGPVQPVGPALRAGPGQPAAGRDPAGTGPPGAPRRAGARDRDRVPRGHRGTELLSLDVRLAPLDDLVLLLAEDQTALRRLDAVRRDFVANVSHELKTPVGALALLAEAVQGSADDPRSRSPVRRPHAARVGRLTMMVQDLIALSRLQSNDPLRAARIVNIDDVVAEAVDTTHLEAEAREIRLEVRGQHGLARAGR